MADGVKYEDIAKDWGLALSTVKKYRSIALIKLGADSSPNAVAMAMRRGIIT
jgi:DNA-binding NarL/FixJ family response regulator